MNRYNDCRRYDDCDYRNDIGECPDDCNQFKHKDNVSVVRCKDCKYYEKAKVNNKGFLICPASGMEIAEADFCSYGERRTE